MISRLPWQPETSLDSCREQWRMHVFPPSDRVDRRLARSVFALAGLLVTRFALPGLLRCVVSGFKLYA